MNDDTITRQPAALTAILSEADTLGFTMASEAKVGALLAALAASRWERASARSSIAGHDVLIRGARRHESIR